MVFSPVLFFAFAVVAIGCPALTAAGPLVVFVLGLLLFFLFFDADFRGDESGLVATGVGGSMTGPPPSVPGLGDADAAAVDAEEEEDEAAEEAAALSRAHSSLWPARHAARWQASLQYLRCRQPEQKCRCWSLARVPQNAHCSVMSQKRNTDSCGVDQIEIAGGLTKQTLA